MNILERIAARITGKTVGPLIGDKIINLSLRQIFELTESSVKQPYKQSIWVYSCVSVIKENIKRVPFVLKKDAGDFEPGLIESGELYELFQNPNPLMNQEELLEATFGYMALKGEAFWILEGRKSNTDIPKEIWTFNPDRFEAVTNKDTGMLIGWKYRGAKDIYFENHEILHFKSFNPYNDLRGLSPLEAAQLSVEQDYQASVYNKSFFLNGATVGGIISIPEELTDEQFTRIVNQFEDRHKGASKAHKVAVIEGGGKFVPVRISQKDMDFVEGKNLTRKEILAAFNVNEVVLGSFEEIKSFQGSKAAHKAFWEECLMPKMIYFENVLWSKFFSKIGVRRGKGRIWAEFDTANVGALQEDYNEKIITAGKMFTMGWPINMINKRLKLGMQEVPWGNEWWVTGSYLSVDMITAREERAAKQGTTPEEEKPEEDAKNFYYDVIADDFKSKFTKLLFNVRKRTLACHFDTKDWNDVLHDNEFDKLKESLNKVYYVGVCSGVSSKRLNFLMEEEKVNDYRNTRSEFVVSNFKMFMEEVVKNVKLIDDVEKVREMFNLISSKVEDLAKNEAKSCFKFGESLARKDIDDISVFFKKELLTR